MDLSKISNEFARRVKLTPLAVLSAFQLSPETIDQLILQTRKMLVEHMSEDMSEDNIKEGRLICEHVTHFFSVRGSFPTGRFVKKGTCVIITIDALVRRRSDNAMAYRCTTITDAVTGENITVKTNKPHITAFCPQGVAPKESLDYVYVDDSDEVEIIPFDETVEATCIWKIY